MQEGFETFTVLINRISRDIRKIKNQEMADYHLRSAHVSCLYYVYSLGRVTSAELCEHCEEDKATISRAVDYLETNGFLLRDTGAKRYKSPLLLTGEGAVPAKELQRRSATSLKRSAMLSRRMKGLHSTVVYPPSAEALRLSSKTAKKRRCDAIENKDHC